VPPKVEYRLTPIARELGESFATLTAWAERHRRAIAAARTAYDRRPGDPASGLAAASEEVIARVVCGTAALSQRLIP